MRVLRTLERCEILETALAINHTTEIRVKILRQVYHSIFYPARKISGPRWDFSGQTFDKYSKIKEGGIRRSKPT